MKFIIFDMDGVLVDSESCMAEASHDALLECGVDVDISDFEKYRGMGDRSYIGGVSEKYGVPYDKSLKERAYAIFCERANDLVFVFPWTKPLIAELSKRGVEMCIASAADRIKVECNLLVMGTGTSTFSSVITGADVTMPKPSPDTFLLAAEAAGLSPNDAIVCEDSLSGVVAAKAAGMYCLAVTTSFSSEELYDAGADMVTDDLMKLLTII